MSDIVVICAHPDLSTSRANRTLLEAISDLPFVTIDRLYERYPDYQVDVEREQSILHPAKAIVLQFPLYWYSSPPLLKAWMDAVLTQGFAYGDGASGLKQKKLMLAVTADASPEFCEEKDEEGKPNLFYLSDNLNPFRATGQYCGMLWMPEFAVFAVWQKTDDQLKEAAKAYRDRLIKLHKELSEA